jgi:hypothetical protein
MWAMRRLGFLTLLFLGLSAAVCHAQGFGKFVGSVQTEWLAGDRKMRLLAPFTYVDPNGVTWTAPAGWVIDGASIPVFAWSVTGGPFQGRYRDASVIHDVACDQKTQPWETVHEAFYWAMMASGVEPWRAKVMYAAVYHFGPRWPRVVTLTVPKNQVPNASERALQNAEPGSGATIVRVRPESSGPASPGNVAKDAERERVEVQIQPPPQRLKEQDFEKLKEQIMQKEANAAPVVGAPPADEPKPAPAPRSRGFGGSGGGGGSAQFSARRGPGGQAGISLQDIRSFKAD